MIYDILDQVTYMKRILDHECCDILESAIDGADAVVSGRLERSYGTAFKEVRDRIKATRGRNLAKSVVVDVEVDEVVTEVVVEQERRESQKSLRHPGVQLEEILCNIREPHEEELNADTPEEPPSAEQSTVTSHTIEKERRPVKFFGEVPAEVADVTEDEKEIGSKRMGKSKDDEGNVVATLLSMWTTLPVEEIAGI